MGIVKGVIVGCGSIAREHLSAVADLKNGKIVAVCDLSAARAEATAERFGIARSYCEYQEMLADVRPDLVHITASPAAHFSIARACLAAGHHVLCEKPIAVCFQEFLTLKKLAQDNQRILIENQNFRFHSSIRRIQELIRTGDLGDLLEVHILLFLNLFGPQSSYADRNTPHFSSALRGGAIGDFLPHFGYLARMFMGPITDVRTVWSKRNVNSPLPADEFRAILKGEGTTGFLSFSGNGQPNGFFVRVLGTKMQVEVDLFSPPRLTCRRLRKGEPALMSLVDGITEGRDLLRGTAAGLWRKLAGRSSYDGLQQSIAQVYRAIELNEPPSVALDETAEISRLVDAFSNPDIKI
jgi:predicted dehydrogenase